MMNGRQEFRTQSLFCNESVGAIFQSRTLIIDLRVDRQYDNFRTGHVRFDSSACLEAVDLRHRDVDQNQIRLKFPSGAHSSLSILGFADELEVAPLVPSSSQHVA